MSLTLAALWRGVSLCRLDNRVETFALDYIGQCSASPFAVDPPSNASSVSRDNCHDGAPMVLNARHGSPSRGLSQSRPARRCEFH